MYSIRPLCVQYQTNLCTVSNQCVNSLRPVCIHVYHCVTAGYNYFGTERLYSGVDGREFEADIFIGIVYYQRLRHMVSDKFQVRVDMLHQKHSLKTKLEDIFQSPKVNAVSMVLMENTTDHCY